MSPFGRSGRKALDLELNLVPYIDLLTCLIAFLLITAVWTQVARLEASQRAPGDGESNAPPGTKLVVLVGADGFNVVVDGDRQILFRTDGRYDFSTLARALGRVKAIHRDKDDA